MLAKIELLTNHEFREEEILLGKSDNREAHIQAEVLQKTNGLATLPPLRRPTHRGYDEGV
jgi:hypothetical protein